MPVVYGPPLPSPHVVIIPEPAMVHRAPDASIKSLCVSSLIAVDLLGKKVHNGLFFGWEKGRSSGVRRLVAARVAS